MPVKKTKTETKKPAKLTGKKTQNVTQIDIENIKPFEESKITSDYGLDFPMKYKSTTDVEPITRVHGKEWSPLIIRRYSLPLLAFVALITDDNLADLDDVVKGFLEKHGIKNGIQEMRNLAGALTDHLQKRYKKSEGVAVVIQADKCTISSLAGDFMNHDACRIEFYGLLNFATGV